MAIKVNVKEIDTRWLDARCLNIMANYARRAELHDETIIEISDSAALEQIVAHVMTTDCADLLNIYDQLKLQLRNLLAKENNKDKLKSLKNYLPQAASSKRPNLPLYLT